MTWGEYVGWVLATLLVPIALPFGVLWGAKQAFEYANVQQTYRFAVKDGQLLWISISLAAAALFDAAQHLPRMPRMGWVLVVWYVTILLASALFISLWTAGSLWRQEATGSGHAGPGGLRLKEASLIRASVLILVVTAGTYAALKFSL